MLYTTNKNLPEMYKDDKGYNLCRLWFQTKFGTDLTEEFLKNPDFSTLDIQEVSKYKIVHPDGELLLIDGKYHVGDGYGNIIYSPCRDTVKYESGDFKIDGKFSVKKKI